MAGSNTSAVKMINIAVTAADGSGKVWQDVAQMIPTAMNGDPEGFVAAIRGGLPLVNNLRVLFNEYSFNPDGTLHPQMERFLAAAAANGYQLTITYGGGDAQNIGIGNATWGALSNAQATAALEANYSDVSGAWTKMMSWMDANTAVKSAVYGWDLMNESAGYRHSIKANGADATHTIASFAKLYADHMIGLSDLVQARADGKVLVGGWGYNGDFLSLDRTAIGEGSVLDYIRAGVGGDLVWSAHLYAGWMGTGKVTSPAELRAKLDTLYAAVAGDDVLITEINAHGAVDNPEAVADFADIYVATYDWFAENGIGLGWYPGLQTGASHLLSIEGNNALNYRHQHSLAHAMDAYSLGSNPEANAGAEVSTLTLIDARLRNEAYQVAAGEALFDTVKKAGFGFGFGGDDTLTGTDLSNDFLYGGTGDDALAGLAADDFLFGQGGDDRLLGGGGIDHLFGGAGADRLDGGLGRDVLAGGDGDDVYVLASGADSVIEYANAGNDTVQTGMAVLSLAAAKFGFVENLAYSGAAAFTGTGNALGNILTGGAAADKLFGGAGNDVLRGGGGADRLDGGSGIDTASYASASARVVANLVVGTTMVFVGEAKGDVLIGIENLEGSGFGDVLSGNLGANTLWGMAGDDRLWGRGGADTLFGGEGADVFVFRPGSGADRVMDFQDNIDSLAIVGLSSANSVDTALARATDVGGNVVFQFSATDSFTVLNTTKSALADDLIFV